MRKYIVPSVLALALMSFAAVSAFAGGGHCTGKTASGSSCAFSKTASMEGMKVETVRMPSGALMVLYSAETADQVKTLQAKAEKGASDFGCGICREMAATKDCKVELVNFSHGVVAFVTSDKKEAIDAFEKQYAALATATTPAVAQ
ncbi:MAG TPA: hypothetical protein VNM87_13095 [Candidatus Udaeobacter sp.]|nr:hypothetical protein [Candidatus Udaeobacter sp.]